MVLFSDLGPGQSFAWQLFTATIFFLVSGLIIGFFNPNIWLLAAIVAWGGVLLAGAFVKEPTASLPRLVVSLGPTLLGGYAGGLVGKKRLVGRLFRFLFRRSGF
ncbi:MAG: hypothetical protein HYX81_05510 [Chloroflexi bacterium]|nr:hypothetical protein [Chloroflexota bacterium]